MRKLKDLFISVLAMAMVAVACTKEEDAPLGAPSISFEQNTMEFEKAGGDQVLELTSTRDWTATCAESWVGLSKVTGTGSVKSQQVTISVDPNDGYDRTASITFVAGDKLVTRNIILRQAGSGPAPITGIFYEVNFKSAGLGEWEINDVVKPDAISEIWKYNASYGLVATAYLNPTNYASESWVISPEIDLSVVQSAHLAFSHAANYFQNVKNDVTLWLQVEGEDGFTHKLDIPVYPTSFTFLESGDIDLQDYVGKKVRLAFKYISTASKAGTYEIQNLRISTDPFETVTPEIPDEGTGSGTAEDPYDVAKADAIVAAGAATSDKVYVKGIISKIKEVDTSYGNATYWISDDGTEAKQFEIYRGYYLGNVKFTKADQIKVGDNVVVYGTLVDFNGTHEMTQGGYIYSLNGETAGTTPDPGTPDTPELPEGTVVYANNFDKAEATKTYGSGSSYPYLDQFDGWKNETGSGISAVDYGFKAVSARSNSASDGDFSKYKGSGSNNLFFGANAYFIVKNITLDEGRNYVLTFGSEKYLTGGDSNFNKDEFKVYVSNDGAKWVALDYQIGSSEIEGKWNLNISETFAVGASDKSLYLYFTASVASAYRLDDITLTAVEEEGRAVDFSAGVSLDGGDTPGTDPAETKTISEMITIADNAAVQSNEVYVAAVTTKGYVALEEGKAVYVYENAAPSVAVGDKASFKGTKTTYYGLPEITSPTTTKISSGNEVPYPTAKDITSTFDSYNASEAEYITFVGTVVKDGNYTNFKVDGATKMTGTLSGAPSSVFNNFAEGDRVRITGFFHTLNTSKNLVQVIYVSSEVNPAEGGDQPGDGGDQPGDSGDQPGDGGEDAGNSVSFDLNQKANTWTKISKDATYGDGYTSTTQGVTVTYYKAASSSTLAGPAADHFKLYKDFVVKVSSDKKIASIVFSCLSSDKCYDLEPVTGGGTAVADTEQKTITWTPETALEELVAKQLNGQSRITGVTVNYLSE